MAWGLGGLGELAAFGTGALKGAETGADLYNKYANEQANQLAMQALGNLGGYAQPAFGGAAGGQMAAPPPGYTPPQQAAPQAPQAAPGPVQAQPMPSRAALPYAQAQLASGLGTPGQFPQQPPGTPGAPQPGQQPGQPISRGDPRIFNPATFQPTPQAPGAPQPGAPGAPQQPPARPPSPELQDRAQAGSGSPREVQNYFQTGMGWMKLPELVARIEMANPSAPAGIKFRALQAASKLLNADGQQQFTQMMQWMNYQERVQHDVETEKSQRMRSDPQLAIDKATAVQAIRGEMQTINAQEKEMATTYRRTKAQHDTLAANMDTLIDLSKKVAFTGNINLDTWFASLRDKLGMTSDQIAAYRSQINTVIMEAASVANVRAGVITEGQRQEAEKALNPNAILPPSILTTLKAIWEKDASNKEKSYKKNLNEVRQQRARLLKGLPPDEPDQPEEEQPEDQPKPPADPLQLQ